MTNNTQFKTLVNTWLNQKQPMITPSTHASFTLIAENHLIPYFGKRKIGSITETDIQSYISYLHDAGRLDKTGGLTVKTIRDVILVLRLSMEFAYKERAIPLLNWDLIEYPKELGIKKVVSLSKDQEQSLIQCIYMNLNRKTAGILNCSVGCSVVQGQVKRCGRCCAGFALPLAAFAGQELDGFGKGLSVKLHDKINGIAALALAVSKPLVSPDGQAVMFFPAVFPSAFD